MDVSLGCLRKKLYRISILGLSNLFRCFYWRFKLKALAYTNGLTIDPWHIKFNIYCRPYKWKVIEVANSLSPKFVIEVGCGIGEIISRVKAEHRIGIDIDRSSIYLANKLNKGPLYLEGSFDKVLDLDAEEIDILIAINFIHGIPEDTLKYNINQILDFKKCKYIITDIYKEDYPERGFVHDLSKYDKRVKLLNNYDDYEGYRYIMLWKVDYNES